MQFGTKPGAIIDDKLKESGQLFRDLIDMGNNKGTKKILVFPPHAAGREAEVLDAIFDGAQSPGTKDELMRMWGLDPLDSDDVSTFKEKLTRIEGDFEIMVMDI
jgi:hypothetical protein